MAESAEGVSRALLMSVPPISLIAALSLQFFCYVIGFDLAPRSSVVFFYGAASALFLVGYFAFSCLPHRLKWLPVGDSSAATEDALLVARFLAIATCAALLTATFRIWLYRDLIFTQFGAARFALESARTGISGIGALNALLLGAPIAYTIYAALRCGREQLLFHQYASLVALGILAIVFVLEGARLPIVFGLCLLISTIVVTRLATGHWTVGGRYLILLALIAALFAVFSYSLASVRERLAQRSTELSVRHYSTIVEDGIRERPLANGQASPHGRRADTRAQPPEHLQSPLLRSWNKWIRSSQQATVAAFYLGHTIGVVDRLLEGDLQTRSHGLLTFWSANKLLELLGWSEINWASVAGAYGSNGQYFGLFGLSIVEFGLVAGLAAIFVWGSLCGFIVWCVTAGGGRNSPMSLFAGYAIIVPAFAPFLDVLSTAAGQSIAIWLFLAFVTEVALRRPRTAERSRKRPKLTLQNEPGN